MMFVLYESATGQPRSFGSVLADPLPEELTAQELTESEAEGIRAGTHYWNAETLAIEEIPPAEEE